MYKVMLADDEGIVIDSMTTILKKNYGDICEVNSARSGRAVIELAESFRPDIAFMDIQMPGINGLDAMREIRKTNPQVIFIVMSAYDKFDYAREAIALGAIEYLNKPFGKREICDVLEKAMRSIDSRREDMSRSLMIREKMETVVPLIENGFINAIVFQPQFTDDALNYKNLLSISEDYGYISVIEFGSDKEGGKLTNAVGMGIKLQPQQGRIRDVLKEADKAVIAGPIMSNKIVCFYPCEEKSQNLNKRIEIIDHNRALIHMLHEKFDAEFRIGIGSPKAFAKISESYTEAIKALTVDNSEVAHVDDLPVKPTFTKDYPVELENSLFDAVAEGDITASNQVAGEFFDWMEENYPDNMSDIQLKTLEFVIRAETLAYTNGGLTYSFTSRSDYLPEVMAAKDTMQLRTWFLSHISRCADNVSTKRNEKTEGIIERIQAMIEESYSQDLSLEETARQENVSPYYLSRLFRERTGRTFMDCLTSKRMEVARRLMRTTEMPMKDVCSAVGYSDPNYFSRIFKKNTGVTPTAYRNGELE